MAIESRDQLYTYFETGDVPTAEEFKNLIDSQLNQESDGITATPLTDGTSSIGIHNTGTNARLNISGDNGNLVSLYQHPDTTDHWLLQDTITTSGTVSPEGGGTYIGGLNLTHSTSTEEASRLFIQHDGKVGLGATNPARKLQLDEQNANDITGAKFKNTAVSTGEGWSVGHLHSAVAEKDNSFVIYEESSGTNEHAEERLTILSGGNVGINEPMPDTTFHVSTLLSDPNMPVDLREGTGIAMFGPIEENVAIDSSSIQARKQTFTEGVLGIDSNTLNLQPLGGDIMIHVDDTIATSAKVIITKTGSFGIGTTAPVEKIDIDGAIKIGTTSNSSPSEGTIRFHELDFEGYTNGQWISFTSGTQAWQENEDHNILSYSPEGVKVGIGTETPTSALHVLEAGEYTGDPSYSSIAAYIRNAATTTGTGNNDIRVGLQIDCDNTWATTDGPTNIGLYVAEVSGQDLSNENYAAVLNGNVVIGDLTGEHLVGDNGVNVLAIQDGVAPTTIAGETTSTSGIQLYSSVPSGAMASAFHVMNGDGTIIKLFQGTALPAAVNTDLPAEYSDTTRSVIINLRNRINALETHLKALGLLPA